LPLCSDAEGSVARRKWQFHGETTARLYNDLRRRNQGRFLRSSHIGIREEGQWNQDAQAAPDLAGFGHAGIFACAAIEVSSRRRLLSGVSAAVLPDRFEPNDTIRDRLNLGHVTTRTDKA